MMMDRNRLGFWTRLVAILLAAGFLISSVFIGFTASGSYNLLEVLGGGQQNQQQQQPQDLSGDISEAEQNLEENPEDPEAIKELASLYASDEQTGEAVSVLEDGMERAPEDAEIPLLLGQLRAQQAQAQPEGEREDSFRQAAEAFAASTERDEENADAYLAAGEAYEQAGESGEAIQYYNGYLDLEPEGDVSGEVRDRIDSLLENSSGGASGEPSDS
ncbi:MAG: hypothetical protein L0G70_02875 [Rubrobacter sp.]|nr:hypothetical protein [Rubrobacter sp.]